MKSAPGKLRGEPKPQSSSASPIPASRPATSEPSRSIQTLFGAYPTNQAQTRYLTTQDLIELHRAVSVEFGGRDAAPGVVESQFGLTNSVQRPQATVFGRDAYPTFPEKAAAFVFAFLQNAPFEGGNRRVALAALVAFCELNGRAIDGRVLDEKTLETLIKRSAGYRDLGLAPEQVFREIRELFGRGIVQQATA